MAIAMPATQRNTMTAVEFEANQPREGRFELLAGEMVEMSGGGWAAWAGWNALLGPP